MRKALILSFLAWGASAAIADVQPLDKTFVRRGVDPTARDTKVFDAPAQSTNAVTKGEYSLRDVDVQVGTSRYDYQHNGSYTTTSTTAPTARCWPSAPTVWYTAPTWAAPM